MIDLPSIGQYAMALIFVLALIAVAALAARRWGVAGVIPVAPGRRRLKVCESLALDGRRRLLLIRRDDVEHLLLLGATGETVVERDIAPQQEVAWVDRTATEKGA